MKDVQEEAWEALTNIRSPINCKLTKNLKLTNVRNTVFKKKLLSLICPPPAKCVFGIYDPKGLSYLTQLRVGLSKLNFHKFKHNFRDTINPMCPTSDGIEDMEHFLLLVLEHKKYSVFEDL